MKGFNNFNEIKKLQEENTKQYWENLIKTTKPRREKSIQR